MELEVLFEDEDVLVCYKPAGVATQTAKMTEPDMVSMIRNYRVAKGESDYVGVIHRLDQREYWSLQKMRRRQLFLAKN